MSSWSRYIYTVFGFGFGSLLTSIFFVNRSALDNAAIDKVLYLSPSRQVQPKFSVSSPIIFVGGFPRSGTTLMRILLETHPDVRCGPETRVIPRLLSMHKKWESGAEQRRLQDAGLLGEPIDKAVGAFILEIIRRNGPPAPRLCNKDPFALKDMRALARFFPNCKFLLMLRDGRAVAHSVFKRKVTISKIDVNDPWDIFRNWEKATDLMMKLCEEQGPDRCLMVKYEKLVLQPEPTLRAIASFLDLTWTPKFLTHASEMKHGNKSRFYLSRSEKSTDQVIHPINTKSLTEWAIDPDFPSEFIYEAHKSSKLLREMGYDVLNIPPRYGKLDAYVEHNTNDMSKDQTSNEG